MAAKGVLLPSKVFISCGQATDAEKEIAKSIRDWLIHRKGYRSYAAIQTQSIQDLNTSVIGNLSSADYYIFIDFRREKISPKEYRGSLFTNQELAIAYLLHFERALFFRQSKVRLEGMAKYVASNAVEFNRLNQVVSIVQREFEKREELDDWTPNYSRHLVAASIKCGGRFRYGDRTGEYDQYIWHIFVENRTLDHVAFSTSARLYRIGHGSRLYPSPDQCYLKWAGHHECYQLTIPPSETAVFDAFAIQARAPYGVVYLHSTNDFLPHGEREPILSRPGRYDLQYQLLALDFPPLDFKVVLQLTTKSTTTTAKLL